MKGPACLWGKQKPKILSVVMGEVNTVLVWKTLIQKIHCSRWAESGKVQGVGNINIDMQL